MVMPEAGTANTQCKFAMQPEKRAKQLAKQYAQRDVQFWKAFLNIPEDEMLASLNNVSLADLNLPSIISEDIYPASSAP